MAAVLQLLALGFVFVFEIAVLSREVRRLVVETVRLGFAVVVGLAEPDFVIEWKPWLEARL